MTSVASFSIVAAASMMCCAGQVVQAQNIGIGIDNPTLAKLQVNGVAGAGRTTVLFGADRGITLHRNLAGIGMNQYYDESTNGRYMYNGFAAVWRHVHTDATLASGLTLTMYPSGADFALLPAGNTVWSFTMNNRLRILTPFSTGVNGQLDVGRGTGVDGTAVFQGTNFNSHFCYSTNEHTYIRGGKISSHVYLNDVANGKVVIGGGGATVGINTNGYIPPTTLEVRQSNGGMELTNTFRTDLPWELRTATGSNANFQLYYAGSLRAQFAYTNGALTAVSDARTKSDIRPLESVLDRVMQLRPVTYYMKPVIKDRRQSIGMLAQNVERLFPELVSHQMPGDGNLMGVNYQGLMVVSVKAVQEEETAIRSIENGVAEMERRLKAIEQYAASKIKKH